VRFGPIDRRAQAEVTSAQRTDTPRRWDLRASRYDTNLRRCVRPQREAFTSQPKIGRTENLEPALQPDELAAREKEFMY
jgi:hypothetical protein